MINVFLYMHNISGPAPQRGQREHVPPFPHPKVPFLTYGVFWRAFYYIFLSQYPRTMLLFTGAHFYGLRFPNLANT